MHVESPTAVPLNEKQYLDHIPIIDSSITYDEFFNEYLLKNQACVIKNITNGWNCSKHWITDNKFNLEYLYSHYGDCDVSVYDCRKRHYNSQETKDMKFMHYMVYLEAYTEMKKKDDAPLMYLKDWHLKEQHPHDDFYDVPHVFRSDWLNEYLVESLKDDYRFVYIGPKGSWTPFHADVFKSYSWSANVYGKKRWILLPPGEENSLKDNLGNLPYDIEDTKDGVKHFEIIQNATDAIFVPSGWYHQVWNLETTVSVNHNWFNGCNVKYVWLDLKLHLRTVLKEIDDCKDMDGFLEHAQVMLKASYGMDFSGFYELIVFIVEKRLRVLRDCDEADKYAMFDLKCACDVLNSVSTDKDVKNLDDLWKKVSEDNYCDKIKAVLLSV